MNGLQTKLIIKGILTVHISLLYYQSSNRDNDRSYIKLDSLTRIGVKIQILFISLYEAM